MSYQVLARKWRPHTFADLVGQQHVVQALVNGLDQDRVHHAFLLTGTRGVGKTTIARILAKCLNCEKGVSSTPCGECGSCIDVDEGRFIDMLEIDAASKTKVDDTRELLETVQYAPTRGRYKVYIIDEVHMLSGHSFNALLKTLEEPPPHVKFILATTDPQKLPITILSRCLRFTLTRLMPDQISGYLKKILKTESIEADEPAIMRIARAADGSMRDGLSLLDQAIAFGGGSLKDTEVASMLGSIDHVHIAAIIDALSRNDAGSLMNIVNELVSQSRNLESALDELAEAMHRIALVHAAPGFRDQERPDWESLSQRAEQISPEDAQLYYQIAITGRRDLGLAPDPRTGLEMTLLRMLAFRPAETGSTSTSKAAAAGISATSSSAVAGGGAKSAMSSNQPVPNEPGSNQTGSDQASTDRSIPAQSSPAGRMSPLEEAKAAFEAMQSSPKKPVRESRAVEPELSFESEAKPEPPLTLAPEPEPEPGPEPEPEHEPRHKPEAQVDPGPQQGFSAMPATQQGLPDWSSLQEKLELSGASREFARNLQLESTSDKHWRFLMPDTLSGLGTEAVVQGLRSALSMRLGHEVTLDLHTATGPIQSVAAATERAEINRMTEAENAIEDDSTVKDLKNTFGAKIIPDSIQPLQ